MNHSIKYKTAIATIVLGCVLADRALGQSNGAGIAFFENRIRPQLVEHCYECHSSIAKKLKGGLRLDNRDDLLKGGNSGPAIVPGKPDESLLIKAVRQVDKDLSMPPRKEGRKKLPDAVLEDLARWVKMGAPYPTSSGTFVAANGAPKSHWSFQPIHHSAIPKVKHPAWCRTSIDRFILAALESHGLQPAAPADRRTLIRRATFDLTGLPPTPAEVEDFLADKSEDAFDRVVDRLLNSPHYGEHWGRHWLDVVRYADTAGDTADYPVPVAWRYRNYVINSFNTDKAYDQFLREQIAGDILAKQGPPECYAERAAATGYLALSRRFGFDSENYQYLTIQDTIDTLGQSVLGLSLGCARCHNHKYDPVSTAEYYGLYGIFESTRYAFPGSEQKAKYRAYVPLLPPDEAQMQWRAFDARMAAAGMQTDAVLRSLYDLDGDFEMQHVAAGGSRGVLVPPWAYDGEVTVTQEAQSPFKNVYAFGKVGVSVPSETNAYQIAQTLHPARTRSKGGVFYVNLDFRLAADQTAAPGSHRFWLGGQGGSPAAEIFISTDAVSVRSPGSLDAIRNLKPKQWYNLRLVFDLDSGTYSGSVGAPGDIVTFPSKAFNASWMGSIDYVAIDSEGRFPGRLPTISIDNLAVQESPFAPISELAPAFSSNARNEEQTWLNRELQELIGIDGDFELQTNRAVPAKPWHPGPNSVVRISSESQSPFRNIFGAGKLGIHLPGSGDYNGFGQTLTNVWKTGKTERLFVSFDFRCQSSERDGEGSWRFYIGHGGGASAGVELFFNRSSFFCGSGTTRELVRSLRLGEWYQVQLELNLKERTCTGAIATPAERSEFTGKFAAAWDGNIDYVFIDSGGHIPGTKPALDADNFVIGESPPPPLHSPSLSHLFRSDELGARAARIAALRQKLAQYAAETDKAKRELDNQLVDGPFEMAYGVVEGTPHNVRIQIRGEPDRLGAEVPRGFLQVLGGGALSQDCSGSGRLELAQWLTRADNPLTARVMVNRLWQYHFGQGLVKTPNDFGTRGQPPTHPELLDYLASRFIQEGWSIKALHRLIMSSAVYQQASTEKNKTSIVTAARPNQGRVISKTGAPSTPTQSSADDFFSPFPRARLNAEEIRDAILFVSGELDPQPGHGHPFPKATQWSFTQHAPFSAVYEHNKRSIYLMTQRIKRHPFLALFDGADPNASTPERRPTTVPTQALFFLNDPFVHTRSEKLAARLLQAAPDESGQIEWAFRLALGRAPAQSERAEAAQFLTAYRAEASASGNVAPQKAALAAYARVLFGSNEFLTVD